MQELSIHPLDSAKFAESKRHAEKWSKVDLDEYAPYSVFAWEFLRRNRFYQALVDKRKDAHPLDDWGFKWHRNAEPTHGLVKAKPYWEAYYEGEPPRWRGLDDFLAQLPKDCEPTCREFKTTLQPGQIAIVLDIGGTFGGKSPWQTQLVALGERLSGFSTPFKYKVMHRTVLLRRWGLLKLMSDFGVPFDSAIRDPAYTSLHAPRQDKKERTPRKIKNEPTLSPFTGMYRKEVPPTTTKDDLAELRRLVYGHGYLKILSGEGLFYERNGRMATFNEIYEEETRKR
jgi:hypothetical protein